MRTGQSKQLGIHFSLYLLYSLMPLFSLSQYILNGSATQNNCNCYTLTQPINTQSGSVWNSNKINLNNSFDFSFNVYLGCQDATGADGIVFILQPVSTSLGTTGEGMGFEGITPSIGIALDTWQNFNQNDPAFDHVSIQANGVVNHSSDLQGPVQASASSDNIEDCQWHTFNIRWNAVTKLLEVYFDGAFRLSHIIDLTNVIFGGDPEVFWGFTAATGGANNLQQFCTALNPDFSTNFTANATCFGNAMDFQDQSVSFAPIQSWWWNFGDGTTSTQQNPPPHSYAAPGIYEVKLVITGLDGCTSDTLRKNVAIGSKPVADFRVFDTCSGKIPRILDLSTNNVGAINEWIWIVDGNVVSSSQQPQLTGLSTGTHNVKLVVKTVYGCESDTAYGGFLIKPSPVISVTAPDGCEDELINFNAVQLDNATSITSWNWDFGDGTFSSLQNPSHAFSVPGWGIIQLGAIATNGCTTSIKDTINVEYVFVNAMDDTLVLPGDPVSLFISYGGNFSGVPAVQWSPASGLDNPATFYPVAMVNDDMTYSVTMTTAAGCTATDSVRIQVFKGSAIYVPTAFTPNNDGLNDWLRPAYIGIKKLDYFRLYNRWGQLVFSTANRGAGWDGRVNGQDQPTGTFVWMLKAEDLAGKIYEMKGTTTIIR